MTISIQVHLNEFDIQLFDVHDVCRATHNGDDNVGTITFYSFPYNKYIDLPLYLPLQFIFEKYISVLSSLNSSLHILSVFAVCFSFGRRVDEDTTDNIVMQLEAHSFIQQKYSYEKWLFLFVE